MRYLLLLFVLLPLLAGSCDVIASTNLENSVKKAIKDDPRTKDCELEISHEGEGRILITGEVWKAEQIDAIKEIAAAVEGVTSVSTRIGVEDNSDSGLMQDGALSNPYF